MMHLPPLWPPGPVGSTWDPHDAILADNFLKGKLYPRYAGPSRLVALTVKFERQGTVGSTPFRCYGYARRRAGPPLYSGFRSTGRASIGLGDVLPLPTCCGTFKWSQLARPNTLGQGLGYNLQPHRRSSQNN